VVEKGQRKKEKEEGTGRELEKSKEIMRGMVRGRGKVQDEEKEIDRKSVE
jgi:hypothetical protein